MREGRGRGGARRDGANFAVLAGNTYEENSFGTQDSEELSGVLGTKVFDVKRAKRCHHLPVEQYHAIVLATRKKMDSFRCRFK